MSISYTDLVKPVDMDNISRNANVGKVELTCRVSSLF